MFRLTFTANIKPLDLCMYFDTLPYSPLPSASICSSSSISIVTGTFFSSLNVVRRLRPRSSYRLEIRKKIQKRNNSKEKSRNT